MNCEIKGRITADLGKRTGVKDGKDWECHEYIVTEMFQYGKNMKFSMANICCFAKSVYEREVIPMRNEAMIKLYCVRSCRKIQRRRTKGWNCSIWNNASKSAGN